MKLSLHYVRPYAALLGAALLFLQNCGAPSVVAYRAATDNAKEFRAFQTSVYKLARQSSCVSCHSSIQTPFFASDDPEKAYDAIMASQKVVFQRPEISRVYLRLAQDEHNCGDSGECKALAKQMLNAIYKWREEVSDFNTYVGVSTDAIEFRKGGRVSVPAGAFVFEAEEGQIVRPKSSASGNTIKIGYDAPSSYGKFLYIPELGRTTPNGVIEDYTNYTYVQYKFLATSNSYKFYARLQGGDSKFKVKLNGNTSKTLTAPGAEWNWQPINGLGNTVKDTVNIVKLGEYDDGPKIDMIVAIPDSVSVPNFANNDELAEFMNRFTGRKKTLEFSLSKLLKDSDAVLKVEASVFDESGYFFENPRIEGYPYNVQVKGVRLLQNGIFNAEDSDWAAIEKVLMTDQAYDELDKTTNPDAKQLDGCPLDEYNHLICHPMLAQRQTGPNVDSFAFSFEILDYTQKVPSLDDIIVQNSDALNSKALLKTLCINCHANLEADKQTHYVVTDAFVNPVSGNPLVLNFDLTETLLKNGSIDVGAKTVNAVAYDSGLNLERVVRPRVLAGDGVTVLPGSGGEGSLLYRILKYGEGPVVGNDGNGRIPDLMVTFRQALQAGITGPALVTSIRDWIDSFPAVVDTVSPIVYEIMSSTDNLGGLMSPGSGRQTKIRVKAIDDLTQVKVDLYVDNEAPVSITTNSLRALDKEYTWPPSSATVIDPGESHRFKAVAEDSSGNRGAPDETASIDIGGCTFDVSDVPTGLGSIVLNQSYNLTARASNRWAADGDTTKVEIRKNNVVQGSSSASGTAEASVVNKSIVFANAGSHTLELRAMNQFDDKAPRTAIRYNCSKEYKINSSISVSTSSAPTLNQNTTITVKFSSPFRVNVNNISLSYKKINDPLSYALMQSPVFVAESNQGKEVLATFVWKPDNINDHRFTATVDASGNGQNTQFATSVTFTPTN